MAKVTLEKVAHGFAETGEVICELDLTIEPGEFVSFLGPSGCGKSTLLRIIAGLLKPEHGRINVDAGGRKFFRGFVFQEAQLLPWRTVLENAALPLELIGRPRSEAREKARMALAKVGLGDSLEKYPKQLSGGMKMRVSVARALVAEPSLLLLDEPFSALDEMARELLQEELRRLWENLGMTVVFVTHSVAEAVFLSERTIVLSSRPARVVCDCRIELGRRRDESTRRGPHYWRLVSEISGQLRLAREGEI